MTRKTKEDLMLETLYEVKEIISSAIDKVQQAEENAPEAVIETVEECLVELNDKTRNIYVNMLSEQLSAMESRELIEAKKASISKRG